MPLLIKFIYEFAFLRNWMKKNFKEPVYGWPEYSDFWITLVGAMLSYTCNTIFNALTWNIFYNICKEKKNEEIRRAKTLKACNSFYKGIYFIFATYWGYTVLKDTAVLPPMLLGKGSLTTMHDNYPLTIWPVGL